MYAFEPITQTELNDMTRILKIGDFEFTKDNPDGGKITVNAVQAAGMHYQDNITKVIGLFDIKNYVIRAVENPNIYADSAFSIKLPFYGTVNITLDKLLSSTEYRVNYGSVNYLVVRCCVDLDTGVLSYMFTVEKDNPSIISKAPRTLRPIINLDVIIAMEIPVSSINYDKLIGNALSVMTNMVTTANVGNFIAGKTGRFEDTAVVSSLSINSAFRGFSS